MKLKKLDIIGFKSFRDRMTITFPPGISAIVGPNGCGKSNIMDSIMWVMGEQSVKQLRGKAMEDMIFAGTNGASPISMAEVSLIFSNDTGTSPEEFKDLSEIMVTRRLFRSGESSYFLNKQPCRLKDIHNLLLGTGINHKKYALVQQGNIGAIIDAGPDERRLFIEEAAGITRYKSQKAEALRKIDATNQNILRVTDIITEVKRQMEGLKRQAKKAEVFKKYQERIKELDVLIAQIYYKDFSKKIFNLTASLKKIHDENGEYTSKLKEIEGIIEEVKNKRNLKQNIISEKKSYQFKIQRKIDKAEQEIIFLKTEIERLIEEISELTSNRELLEGKNKKFVTEVKELEEQNISLEKEITSQKGLLDEKSLILRKLKNILPGLDQNLETYKASLIDLSTREAKYKNLFQSALNNKDNLKRRLRKIDEEIAIASHDVKELENKETKLNFDASNLKEKILCLTQEIEANSIILKEKNNLLINQIKSVQSLNSKMSNLVSHYNALRQMSDNYEWYKDGVKAIIKNGMNNMGLVADILEVEESFETCVELLLGDSLQYIIVQDEQSAKTNLFYLQANNFGRLGFIPMSNLNKDKKEDTNSSYLLLNHISSKPGFEHVIKILAGETLVCENLDDALQIWKQNHQKIVTKDGHMIYENGIIVGGSFDKTAGILSKKQELKDLEKQIKVLEESLEESLKKQKELEIDARNLETNLKNLEEEKKLCIQDETQIEKDLYKISQELKHARRNLNVLNLEQEQLLGEEDEIIEAIEKYNKIIAETSLEIKDAQKNVTLITEKIKETTSEIERFNESTVELKITLTELMTKFENTKKSLKRMKEFQEDSVKRLEEILIDIKKKEEKKEFSKQKITEYEKNLISFYSEISSLDIEIKKYEEEYKIISSELKDREKELIEIQSTRESIIEKIHQLEFELSEQTIKREGILARIKENYQQSLLDFEETIEKNLANVEDMEQELSECRKRIANITDVNLGAISEYDKEKERHDFLTKQHDDLVKAVNDLHNAIKKINKVTEERFLETFNAVNEKLNEVVLKLFEGGSAELVLTEPGNILETGIEFMVHPPGKKLSRMSLLSGGEKALSAIAFIFSIFLIKPAAFCLMDEIDAALDDANVSRFNNLLKIIGEKSQIVIVTHKTRSMEFADSLFGVTMEQKGISKIVSISMKN
ncbi:MAG: chromosome segregation protein SMC [Desulfobacterales bacterium]|nr:chromosome segregation protein SMC [Desulfobacterales bacterium]